MILSFAKMHGLGNDFMVVDAVSQNFYFNEGQIRALADRHRGVGFDQLLAIEPPPHPDVDFHYRIFNADGSEVEQCGNGARCVAKFVRKMGLTWKNTIKVSTSKGVMRLQMLPNGLVCVDMGIPQLDPSKIPLRYAQRESLYQANVNGIAHSFSALSMGNPHAVILVDDLEATDVTTIGSKLAVHNVFPEGANVGFMQAISSREIKLRVFERGAGETLACGSGACASVVAGRLQYGLEQRVKVVLTGGHLFIDWVGEGQTLSMTGPADFIYQGYIEL